MANLGYGSSGSDVRELQNALIAAGYDVGSTGADGIYGAKTQAAVTRYQQDNGLAVDGIAGVQTKGSLYRDDNKQEDTAETYSTRYVQPAAYTGGWGDDTYKDLTQQAVGMNYEDWLQGDRYKALADRFGIQGRMAMQDVLGETSSRTGGLASSYATTAAAQQYNEWMSLLEEVARSMYDDERSDLIENAGLARDYADYEYDRYLDQLSQIAASVSSSSSGGGGGYGGGYGGDDGGGEKTEAIYKVAEDAAAYKGNDNIFASGATAGLMGPALAAAKNTSGGGSSGSSGGNWAVSEAKRNGGNTVESQLRYLENMRFRGQITDSQLVASAEELVGSVK